MLNLFWAGFAVSLALFATLLLQRAMTRDEDETKAAARRAVLRPGRDDAVPRSDLDKILGRQFP